MPRRRHISFFIALLLLAPCLAHADPAPAVIFDMDTVRHRPGEFTGKDNKKVPAGTAELVDGKFGKAVKFSFVQGSSGGFMTAGVNATPEWDRAGGFSFWVKGDGSDAFGGIEVIDKSDFGVRYGYCFPIDSTEWRKVVVPWRDLIPELAAPPVNAEAKDPKSGYAPHGFGNFWFGKWFYWHDYSAHSYAIDQVALEPKIEPDPDEAKYLAGRAGAGAAAGQAEGTQAGHDRDDGRFADRQAALGQPRAALGRVAGQRHQGQVRLRRHARQPCHRRHDAQPEPDPHAALVEAGPGPDLVIVWFGGNDWGTGVRGERFAQYLRLAVDRVRRQTKGSADVLLLTTCPSHAAWETMRELEQAVRDVGKEKKTAVADVAAEFRKVATPDEALKQGYWAWDKTHLGAKGHEVVKDTVLRAIESSE